jgi:hypothetical protein
MRKGEREREKKRWNEERRKKNSLTANLFDRIVLYFLDR